MNHNLISHQSDLQMIISYHIWYLIWCWNIRLQQSDILEIGLQMAMKDVEDQMLSIIGFSGVCRILAVNNGFLNWFIISFPFH